MITCLHVIENPGFISGKLFSREAEKKIRFESELKLASKVNKILSGDESVSFELIVTSGKVYRKIVEKASELDADLLIMGRSDATHHTKSFLGTNSTRVIERSNIPVLTLSNGKNQTFRHMLVPIDLSAPVTLQLAKAIEIAELLRASVTVCTILNPGWPKLEAAYRKRLIEIKKLFAQYDIFCRVKLIITEKKVVDGILSCYERYHPDMLFLMTQEESEIPELSIGSNAYRLICKSEIPVLTITPVLKTDLYPYKSLFGSINKPINWYDLNDHLVTKD
jgi:nucleotide-binding universal stress UspA family protein